MPLMPAAFEPAIYLEQLQADLAAMAALPATSLDATVDACPGWTVADLYAHHVGVLRFATAQLLAEPGGDLVAFDPAPDDVAILDEFAASAGRLLDALDATDPAEHRPNWAGAPEASFWWRRMVHEAIIHRFDAEAATGTAAEIDRDMAVDGVEELIDVFLPTAKRRGIVGTGETLHLHATDDGLADGAGEWHFTFTPDGVAVDHAHAKGDMAVRGPAADLLLFAWNRRPIAVDAFGDPDPLAWWAATVRI